MLRYRLVNPGPLLDLKIPNPAASSGVRVTGVTPGKVRDGTESACRSTPPQARSPRSYAIELRVTAAVPPD